MKKILLTIGIVLLCFSFAQSQTLKLKASSPKYENVIYRTPGEAKSPFLIDRIVYSTSHKGKANENLYQISIYGRVNGKKKQVNYTAKSPEEFDYYRRIFKTDYKQILVYENYYNVGGKQYNDVSIGVEY